MNTLERLIAKADDNGRIPSITAISKLLTEYGIQHNVEQTTNIVEYRSKGRRYVNSRHNGKKGLKLTIKNPYICLDTSESYYSWNSQSYAEKLVKLINSLKSI